EQKESLVDAMLVEPGMCVLDRSMQGDEVSAYQLGARIASWHCVKEDSPEKWESILALYYQVLRVNYSPSAALNRIFAFYKVNGARAALQEAEHLKIEENHFYFLLLGELYRSLDRSEAAGNFRKAQALAKTE